ncbi:hypothetical protein DMH18_26625 [Streptomyces sp. WAC 06783]|uniref:hypothetical protein n=1 Tax=Streptomyces sp. WAC 06783 TaxID=2203211 RepID=UPI000F73EB1C|nr:hypothetical protein [Streptomyces sp. WAC 06783]RSO07013.1 hypothetical protein DMH18_26625 [Streptomyces sp. WAC 06783]
MLIRIGTYNLFNLSAPRSAAEKERYDAIVEVIRGLDVHALCVQEVLGTSPEEAGLLLRQLAQDTGLECMTAPDPASGAPSGPAIAASQHGHPDASGAFRGNFHVGVLWAPDVEPVPGGWRAYNGLPDFWHALATIRLDFGSTPIKVGSFQGDPFRPDWRYNEARRVTSAFLGQLGILGADFNCISADTWPGTTRYYDHDPYTEQDHDLLEYQILWRDDPSEPPVADRRAAEVMRRQGLLDAAPLANAPWHPSCGHWTDAVGTPDIWGPRRIDTLRVTRRLAPGVHTHRTVQTTESLAASDHLPVVTEIEPDKA